MAIQTTEEAHHTPPTRYQAVSRVARLLERKGVSDERGNSQRCKHDYSAKNEQLFTSCSLLPCHDDQSG